MHFLNTLDDKRSMEQVVKDPKIFNVIVVIATCPDKPRNKKRRVQNDKQSKPKERITSTELDFDNPP